MANARNVRVVTGPRSTGNIERTQELADALTARALRSRNPEQPWPVATAMSPWEGVAQLGEAFIAGRLRNHADELARADEERQKAANAEIIRQLAPDTHTLPNGQTMDVPAPMSPVTGQPNPMSDRARMLTAAVGALDPHQAGQALGGAMLSQALTPPKTDEPYTLGQGEGRYVGGRLLAERAPAPAKEPGEVGEYQFYAQQEQLAGRRPLSYGEWRLQGKRAGASNVSVNTGEDRWGKPPTGYYRPDPAKPDVAPMPGSQDAYDRATTENKAATRTQQVVDSAENVIGTARDAAGMVNGWTTGWGSLLQNVPESDAKDLQTKLTTIKANLGFDRLQAMRDASPTGGALGQVAIQELAALQAALASLDQAQSGEQLVENLNAVIRHYEGWKRVALGGAQMLQRPDAAGSALPVDQRARGYFDE